MGNFFCIPKSFHKNESLILRRSNDPKKISVPVKKSNTSEDRMLSESEKTNAKTLAEFDYDSIISSDLGVRSNNLLNVEVSVNKATGLIEKISAFKQRIQAETHYVATVSVQLKRNENMYILGRLVGVLDKSENNAIDVSLQKSVSFINTNLSAVQ
jgi:hypothetical protein